MVKIVGYGDFVRGFRLVGVKSIELIKAGKENDVECLLESDYNLIILDGRVFKRLKGYLKDRIVTSKKPLFFVLDPESEGDESLRFMIKKVLGVEIENI